MSTDDNDERKALTKALAVLRALRPPNITAADIQTLRQASYQVTRALTQPQFSSEMQLNNKRGETANAISAVNGAAYASTLSQGEIDRATSAVAALLASLDG
jgi:hypothetical protein